MKQRNNGGYSLVEILIAIAILGAIMIPTTTSLIMSIRINDRTDEMMQAQLAVSSAVETLMAEGLYEIDGNPVIDATRFPNVTITPTGKGSFYNVTVVSKIVDSVCVETSIRKVEPPVQQGGGE